VNASLAIERSNGIENINASPAKRKQANSLMNEATASRNVYEREIHAVLPRVLALFDDNPISRTRGLGDRVYWSWKLIDYANATPQGLIHGLALLATSGKLPWNIERASIVARIDAAIEATRRQCAADGSLVEAFPNEKSFCVTALIAFDILCAADALVGDVDAATLARWRGVVAPMIAFLVKYDETHAIISNHLATAAAALSRWTEHCDDDHARRRTREILDIILRHQSDEGWFMEYDGADPGYETLGLGYLADIFVRHPSDDLRAALGRSLRFLAYAAHPDGSFGGMYGSRNTRFIYPAALELLAGDFPAAAALAGFARRSIQARTVPTLSTMDDPNLAPMFNSYCRAFCSGPVRDIRPAETLPCQSSERWRLSFAGAGLHIDNDRTHYTIVSTLKGGVVCHFNKDDRMPRSRIDAGVAIDVGGRIFTTQAPSRQNRIEIDADRLIVESEFVAAISEQQTPFKMIVLRMLSLTVFRSRALLEIVKRMLVRRLITNKSTAGIRNRRTITFGPDPAISDDLPGSKDLRRIVTDRPFRSIHMASSGYWQIGDDRP
jgi:hypothetical protein